MKFSYIKQSVERGVPKTVFMATLHIRDHEVHRLLSAAGNGLNFPAFDSTAYRAPNRTRVIVHRLLIFCEDDFITGNKFRRD